MRLELYHARHADREQHKNNQDEDRGVDHACVRCELSVVSRQLSVVSCLPFIAVIKRRNHLRHIAPVGFDFNVEFEEHFGWEQSFQFPAGLGADLLQHVAARANNDGFLRVPLHHDTGVDTGDSFAFLEVVDDDGGRVGKFFRV